MGKAAQQRNAQERASEKADNAQTALVVGNLSRWTAEGRTPVDCDTFQFSEFANLTADLLATLTPDIILSPLFGDDFDAIEVAVVLGDLGFQGQYRVITETLPNSDMIRREVRSQAPDLDFDLMMMAPVANTD